MLRALLLLLLATPALAQTPTNSPPNLSSFAARGGSASPADLPACTLEGKTYHCSKPNALQALASTRTISLVSQPANHASDNALASLAKSLDKSPATNADLTLRLTPIEPAGVTVGSGSVDLAMLNLFAATPTDPTARLLWSETYTGDPDMPWPSIVNALARQFKSHLGLR